MRFSSFSRAAEASQGLDKGALRRASSHSAEPGAALGVAQRAPDTIMKPHWAADTKVAVAAGEEVQAGAAPGAGAGAAAAVEEEAGPSAPRPASRASVSESEEGSETDLVAFGQDAQRRWEAERRYPGLAAAAAADADAAGAAGPLPGKEKRVWLPARSPFIDTQHPVTLYEASKLLLNAPLVALKASHEGARLQTAAVPPPRCSTALGAWGSIWPEQRCLLPLLGLCLHPATFLQPQQLPPPLFCRLPSPLPLCLPVPAPCSCWCWRLWCPMPGRCWPSC